MGIFTFIGNSVKAVAAYFGWAQQRDVENNSPSMQANASAKTNSTVQSIAASDVASGDLSKEEHDVS